MIEMKRSSGNIFEDLGVQDAENMKLRAELVAEVLRTMEEAGWNQTEAAKHFGVTRTRLNDALRGRLEKVTIDRLVMMLAAVGRHVHVTVNRTA
ncbi:MAG: helix-turn-helix transcriptional regulator [Aquisalimonadaceae bacterium]